MQRYNKLSFEKPVCTLTMRRGAAAYVLLLAASSQAFQLKQPGTPRIRQRRAGALTAARQRRPLTATTAGGPPAPAAPVTRRRRWRSALPQFGKKDPLDRQVLGVCLPSIANLAVIPLVGAVDTFWVGRMGDALALAGQGAANQCFSSVFFLIAFIPTITAPLVAKAAGEGDTEGACRRVCEALFLANLLGALGTVLLVAFPQLVLGVVLPKGAPAAAYATNYLRLRAVSLVHALVSAGGFAAFRGLLDTVTPYVLYQIHHTHRLTDHLSLTHPTTHPTPTSPHPTPPHPHLHLHLHRAVSRCRWPRMR